MNRRSILIASALLLTAGVSTASAQVSVGPSVSFGVLAGANFAKVSDAGDGINSRTGFVGGLSADFHLPAHFGIEIDGLYSQQGAKGNIGDSEVTIHVDYVQVPVLLRYQFPTGTPVRPFIVLGPQVGFRVKCEATSGSESASCKDFAGVNAKSTDFSGTAGAGLGFKLGKSELSVQGRYNLGFTKIFDTTESTTSNSKNRVFSVMAGLSF
jgi:hypothetical protein